MPSARSSHQNIAKIFPSATNRFRQRNFNATFTIERSASRQINDTFATDQTTSRATSGLKTFLAELLTQRCRAFSSSGLCFAQCVLNWCPFHNALNNSLICGRKLWRHQRILANRRTSLNVDALLSCQWHFNNAATAFSGHHNIFTLRRDLFQQCSGFSLGRPHSACGSICFSRSYLIFFRLRSKLHKKLLRHCAGVITICQNVFSLSASKRFRVWGWCNLSRTSARKFDLPWLIRQWNRKAKAFSVCLQPLCFWAVCITQQSALSVGEINSSPEIVLRSTWGCHPSARLCFRSVFFKRTLIKCRLKFWRTICRCDAQRIWAKLFVSSTKHRR